MNSILSASTRSIPASDPVLTWSGAIEVEHTAGWSRAWRLPRARRGFFPSERLLVQARAQAGVRVLFGTDAVELGGRCVETDAAAPVDLVVEGRRLDTATVAPDGTFRFGRLPAGTKTVEMWLPHLGDFRLVEVDVDGAAGVWPAEETRPKLVAYGSSITHCGEAASSSRTWPALVARNLGMDLTSLGFGGECHLDPMIARLIRDRAADMVIACLGINVYGAGTFTRRSFVPAILGFVSTIRDGHPGTPIVVMSPIFSPSRETHTGQTGMTLAEMRAEVADAVRILRADGDVDVHLVDGLDILGADQEQLLPDGLHPNADGYVHMAEMITPRVRGLLVETEFG